MPFDPFFSSGCHDEAWETPEGRELYHRLKDMPLRERKKTLWKWKGREMTQAEKVARRLISRELNTRYSYKNRTVAQRDDAKRLKAAQVTKTLTGRFDTVHSQAKNRGHGLGAK